MSTVDFNGQIAANMASPSSGSDGANKDYVDTQTAAVAALVGTSGGGGMAPTYIAPSQTFTVAANTQVLFNEPIDMDTNAELLCDGILTETN